MKKEERPYASRGGLKLAAALRAFAIDANGLTCVDFGSHVGGFVDCLLQHGAARVHAVEPGYGVLAYRLRKDPRVITHERTNALSFSPPESCDFATVDVGWTPLRLIMPVLRRCLKADSLGAVVLIKPQYEADPSMLERGVLRAGHRVAVLAACRGDVRAGGWEIAGEIESPLKGRGGNVEYLWWLKPTGPQSGPVY